MKRIILLFTVLVLILSSCVSSVDETGRAMLRITNGAGAAEYFGSWIDILKYKVFWVYAITFTLIRPGQGYSRIIHIILCVALYVSFHWDYDPARAIIIPYFVCMPLLYIPIIKNSIIDQILLWSIILSLLFLAYEAWIYEGFFSWIIDMFVWCAVAYGGAFLLIGLRHERCPSCGHYALSWKGQTKQYNMLYTHFNKFTQDCTDISEHIPNTAQYNIFDKTCLIVNPHVPYSFILYLNQYNNKYA